MPLSNVLSELEDVVRDLESGELPLERALDRFEEGVRLVRRGGSLLEQAQERIEVLLADDGKPRPFDVSETDKT